MRNLTPPSVRALLNSGTVRKYSKGQLVLYEGDAVQYLYYLQKGTIKAYDIDAEGNEKIINLIAPGDFFPMLAILEENGKIATFYGTITDCEIVVVPRTEFMKLLQADPAVGFYFLKWFTERVKNLVLKIGSMSKTDTIGKLYTVLQVLMQWHSKPRAGAWHRVDFPVNQQLLADMAGVTRESINIAFNEAKQAGIVRSPRNRVLEINSRALGKHL